MKIDMWSIIRWLCTLNASLAVIMFLLVFFGTSSRCFAAAASASGPSDGSWGTYMIKEVVDKIGIASVALLVVFYFNKKLEHFKTREALIDEFASEHIKMSAEIWEKIYSWESFIHRYEPFFSIPDDEWQPPELQSLIDISNARALEIRNLVDRSRFWLGNDLYQRFVDYHNCLEPYIQIIATRDSRRIHTLRTHLDCHRQDVLSLLSISRSSIFDRRAV
jgi:hypothetical protein